jgi:hypothetical protein
MPYENLTERGSYNSGYGSASPSRSGGSVSGYSGGGGRDAGAASPSGDAGRGTTSNRAGGDLGNSANKTQSISVSAGRGAITRAGTPAGSPTGYGSNGPGAGLSAPSSVVGPGWSVRGGQGVQALPAGPLSGSGAQAPTGYANANKGLTIGPIIGSTNNSQLPAGSGEQYPTGYKDPNKGLAIGPPIGSTAPQGTILAPAGGLGSFPTGFDPAAAGLNYKPTTMENDVAYLAGRTAPPAPKQANLKNYANPLAAVDPRLITGLSGALRQAEKATGKTARINDIYRTPEHQASYGPPVAGKRAGANQSWHQAGIAADIQPGAILNALTANGGQLLSQYGLSQPMPGSDPAHIQLVNRGGLRRQAGGVTNGMNPRLGTPPISLDYAAAQGYILNGATPTPAGVPQQVASTDTYGTPGAGIDAGIPPVAPLPATSTDVATAQTQPPPATQSWGDTVKQWVGLGTNAVTGRPGAIQQLVDLAGGKFYPGAGIQRPFPVAGYGNGDTQPIMASLANGGGGDQTGTPGPTGTPSPVPPNVVPGNTFLPGIMPWDEVYYNSLLNARAADHAAYTPDQFIQSYYAPSTTAPRFFANPSYRPTLAG